MDRLVDLITFLFQETRSNRPTRVFKNNHYTILSFILIAVVNLAAYFLSFLYGNWISIICTALTFLVVVAVFGIPLIADVIRQSRTPNRPDSSHRHPLEEHHIVMRRFRVVGKTDQIARKQFFPYQKKRNA